MKVCSICKQNKSTSSFPKRYGKRKNEFHSYCFNCKKEYSKEHDKNRRYKRKEHKQILRQRIIDLKNNPCSDCGLIYPHYVMEFDHLYGKAFSISQGVNKFGWKQIQKEISKCELVCSNCHKNRTFNKKSKQKTCHRTSTRPQRVAEREYRQKCKDYIQKAKSIPCTDCDIQYSYWVMQFDHMRNKKYTIANIYLHVGLPTIRKEIEKCEIVCANCHAKRTYLKKSIHDFK